MGFDGTMGKSIHQNIDIDLITQFRAFEKQVIAYV